MSDEVGSGMICKCGGELVVKGDRILKKFECRQCGRVYDFWETLLCIDPFMAVVLMPTLYKRALERKDEKE
jgi:hypothetical protein